MLHISEISSATLERLNEDLAAAGRESNHTCTEEARKAYAQLLWDEFPNLFWLCDSASGAVLHKATKEQTIESALAGHEGHILVNGRRCFVV